MRDLKYIARVLGGEVTGTQVLVPAPGHSPRDRSLAIRLDIRAPDGFILYSHAGDDWRTCREYVRRKLGLPEWEPGDDRHNQRTIPPQHIDTWDFACCDKEAEIRPRTEDDMLSIARAQRIWREGSNPLGTPVEKYLQSRALLLPDSMAGTVLRFHPHCPWRNENTGKTDFIPCLLAAFHAIDDGILTAVHRIRLDQPERWPKTQRRMLGPVHRSAIKLDPAGNVLTIGEGVETCMAARTLGLGPAWALGSVGAISFFPVIDDVRQLTILAESGDASAQAVQICGRRWRRAGRQVALSKSRVGSDHNDILIDRMSSHG
jgi:putative DNA primase/helicase